MLSYGESVLSMGSEHHFRKGSVIIHLMFKTTMIAVVLFIVAMFVGGYLYESVFGLGGDAPVTEQSPPGVTSE